MKRKIDIYEPDDWSSEGSVLFSVTNKKIIREAFDKGAIIVQHWFYRAATEPEVIAFNDFESFDKYIKDEAIPGDLFGIWSFGELCNRSNSNLIAKLSDDRGFVPKRGSY